MEEREKKTEKEPARSGGVRRLLLRLVAILLETALLVIIALYGVMFVLARGPSPTARNLFVLSVRETSAVGFLANLFFSEEEIAQMEDPSAEEEYRDTDTSLIVIPPDSDGADPWGLVDEDGDGIILEEVYGEGYHGYMMVVLDPARVIMGSRAEDFGVRGYTVAEMVESFDAVAGINAGGFYDPDGRGNGSIPDTLVVSDGKVYYPERGTAQGFAGFDRDHILHVGRLSADEIRSREIQSGVCFGPVLISNGEPRSEESLPSGINPRTGIGQRSDGAVLLLVIEGRQVTSLGATYYDMVEVFQSYGAVNACNMDGGSSSMMWFDGDYVNKCGSVVGIRRIPTTFLVLKEGEKADG